MGSVLGYRLFGSFRGGSFALADEEYKFDLSEIEKKLYHIGGYLELKPSISRLGSDASLYKLRFFNRAEGNTLEEYNGKLQLEGSLRKELPVFSIRTNSDLKYSYLGWDHKTSIYEGYLSLKPSPS